MIHGKVFAGFREKTLFIFAHALCQLFLAGGLAKICSRTSHIMDISLKFRILCHSLGFPDQ